MADPVTEQLFAQYPWIRALFGIPEVASLILEAADPNVGFDPNAFQAKLFNTTWWKTTPEPARQQFIQQATDPATALLATQASGSSLLDWLNTMGVAMASPERDFLASAIQARGEDVNSPVQKLGLRNWLMANPQADIPGGRLQEMTKQIWGMARNDFFLPVEEWWARGWAVKIATGETDEATLHQHLLDQAANAFPHMGDWISQGMTPAQLINPMRQLAADELEIGIEQIDIGRPEWKFLTGVPNENGTSGTPGGWRLPTQSEVQKQARSDARWWQTSKGREQDATSATSLLQTFGIMG